MTHANAGDNWRSHLLERGPDIHRMLKDVHRIAVLGIKTEEKSGQPAYYVPKYAHDAGYEIIPVPVYHQECTEIFGQPVYREVAKIPGEVDLVNVFRRPSDIPAHVDDIIAKKPKAVWFQLGIVNNEAAEKLARAGIDVVQDHCLMVELRKIGK